MIIYIFAIVILLATLVAHLSGIHGLYMQYPGYDIFMHLLGGIGIGLAITAFVKLHFSVISNVMNARRNVVLGVLAVGIVWELFEMYFNIAGAPVGTKAYYIDTVKDLINDCIGGAIVAWLVFRKRQ